MMFSYDRAWTDTVAMVRANLAVLLTVAGALIFLPDFIRALLFPAPAITQLDRASIDLLAEYFSQNWLAILLSSIVMRLGEAVVLFLLLDRARPTVGEALQKAVRILPFYFLANMLVSFIVFTGLIALIVPGIYLLGRVTLVAPTIVAERLGPIAALERSMVLTANNGWRIAGLVLVVALVATIVMAAIASVIAVILGLVVSGESRLAFDALIGGATSTVAALVMLVLTAAIYRQLARD